MKAIQLFALLVLLPGTVHAQHVRIKTNNGYGSGTYVGGRWVMTAAHLFDPQDSPVVEYADGSSAVTYIAADSKTDVAFVQTKSELPLTPARIAEHAPSTGEQVRLIGYARAGSKPTLMTGRVDAKGWVECHGIEGAAAIEGMSGGPAYNDRGEVIAPISCAGGEAGQTTLVPKNDRVWKLLRQVQYVYGDCYGGYCVPQSSGVIVQTTPPQTTPGETTSVQPVQPDNNQKTANCDCKITPQQITQITQSVVASLVNSDALKGEAGPQGPQGVRGPQGPQGKTPTDDELKMLIRQTYIEMQGEASGSPIYYSITPRGAN